MKFVGFPEFEADQYFLDTDNAFVTDGKNKKTIDKLEFSLTDDMITLFDNSNERSRRVNEDLFYELFPQKSLSFTAHSFRSICLDETADNRNDRYFHNARRNKEFLEMVIVNEMINRYINNNENFTMKEFIANKDFMSSVYQQWTTLTVDDNVFTDEIIPIIRNPFKEAFRFNAVFISALISGEFSSKAKTLKLSRLLEEFSSFKVEENYKLINQTPKTMLSILNKQVFHEETNVPPCKENTDIYDFIANFSAFYIHVCDYRDRYEIRGNIDKDLFNYHIVEMLNFYQENEELFNTIATKKYEHIKNAIEKNNPNKETPFGLFFFLILVIFKASKQQALTDENIENIVNHVFTLADSEDIVFNADTVDMCVQLWTGGYLENVSLNMAINIFV